MSIAATHMHVVPHGGAVLYVVSTEDTSSISFDANKKLLELSKICYRYSRIFNFQGLEIFYV